MKLKAEDVTVSVELARSGFGPAHRVVCIEHLPSGLFARAGMERSDFANKEVAWKTLQKKVRAYYKNPPKKKFTYAIGHYWDPKDKTSVGCYAYHTETHSGTLDEANGMLKYVKEQSPERDWKVFMLVEVPQ